MNSQGGNRQFQFLLPRTSIKQSPNRSTQSSSSSPSSSQSQDGAYVTDLEYVILQSYTGEYILRQYFPDGITVEVVEPNAYRMTMVEDLNQSSLSHSQSNLIATETYVPPNGPNQRDSFGRLIMEQPFVVFTVKC